MTAHLLNPSPFLGCPSCGLIERVTVGANQARMHPCPALGGLAVPLTPKDAPDARQAERHVVVQSELDGTAVAVRTDRPDGSNDLTVYPGTATLTAQAHL